VFAVWHGGARDSGRFSGWHAEWTALMQGELRPV